ncbi:hypothetical protein [Cupriavidus sp. YAF13]|uniref:hypothetical protein n=1 Tax=Cupriavidus sp. YAF13 TaxID=3233075 RepID=UPI003F904141
MALAFALLCSLLVPVQVQAQTLGGAAVDYAYQRTMANIVSGSAAGLQISRGATMNILNGGRIVGTIALNEKRLIDIATMAKIARAATVPGIIAIGATELLNYGLQKCADGTWCKPAAPAGGGDLGMNWPAQAVWGGPQVAHSSAQAACQDFYTSAVNGGPRWPAGYYVRAESTGDPKQYACRVYSSPGFESWSFWNQVATIQASGCRAGYVLTNGSCISTTPVPAADADVETAWKGAFQAKPYLMVNSFGFEDQTTQNQQWADALAQLADVIAPGSATVAEPATSTTTSAGTTKVQRTCTYTGTANADAATQKDQPLSVGTTCVTTTTNPDGTTTTKTETTDAAPKGAAAAPPKVDVETCGLPGKPACKIDETGTKAQSDVDASLTARSAEMDSRLTVVQQAANDALSSVEAKHGSVHILDFFNVFPTFAIEQCENPKVPGVGGGELPVDICTYYYMLKDVVSFGVVLLTIIDSIQVVREAVKV